MWVLGNKVTLFLRLIFRLRMVAQNSSCKAVLFLNFWGIFILFSTVAVPACIPTNSALGFLFLHILASTCWLIY